MKIKILSARIRWMVVSTVSTIAIVTMFFSQTWQAAKAAVLTDLVAPGATLQTVATGFGFVEGPVWHRDGYLLFSDQTRNQIMKWHPISGLTTYRSNITGTNGLTFDAQNRLLIAQQAGRQLTREETSGGTLTTLAITYQGKRLNSPNDVITAADGSIYFTDPPYGTPANDKQLTFNGVFRLTPSGTLTTIATDFDHPNGLAFSPNEKILYVADTPLSQIRAFDVLADGSLANSRIFATTSSSGPDGMKVDVNGNLWVAGPGGVWVFDPAGQKIGVISVPEVPANIAFGGSDLKTLYITARTGLYSIRLQVAGIPHYGLRNASTPTATVPTSTSTRTLTPGSPTATGTQTLTPTPTRTSTAGPTATRTRTPTAGPSLTSTRTSTTGGPTATRTPTATTPSTGGACSPVTSTVTAPFTFDGAGTFCWQSNQLGSYINSWNTTSVTINGVNATNIYIASGSYPAQIGGFWYIRYNSAVAWGHFEAKP